MLSMWTFLLMGIGFMIWANSNPPKPDWLRLGMMLAGGLCLYAASRAYRGRYPKSRAGREGTEEQALRLRNEAMRLRMMGQFDAAYRAYRQALPLYEKLGDVDAQCNVLCSLAESTASRDERSILVGKIQALCDGIQGPQERERALRNLEALRQRLSAHPL